MQTRQLYTRLLSNLLIPVLGFLLWDWSLYFILLFYMLDIVSSEIVVHLKIKKIQQVGKKTTLKSPSTIYGIISFLFLIATIAELNLGTVLLHPDIDLKGEIWEFITYKELGIQQGFLLIPLVGMMAYSSYKMEFIFPKHYLHQEEKPVWKDHLRERFLLLSFCVILTLFSVGFNFQEWVILTIILVTTTGYNYLQGREQISSGVTP